MLRGSGCSFGKSPHFSFPSSRFQSSFFVVFFTFPPFPWRSETRATFLKKKKHTTRPITSDSGSSPSPLRQHSSAVLSSQVTCTPAFLCPRSQRRPTPRICFYMRVMTRGSAQLCSLGTKCGIPVEAGQQRRYLVTQTSSSSSSRTCAVLLLSRPCCQNTLGSHSTLSFWPWSNLLTAI